MLITYSSNNSGGDWWLTDDDWASLEKAGWTVKWRKERFLDALATEASKEFDSIESAIKAWERIVGQYAGAKGCSCCGQPHNFYEE